MINKLKETENSARTNELKSSQKMKLDVTNVFSKVSDLYDAGRIKFFSDFGKMAVERMNIKPDTKVLDIATGRGAILFPAYNKVGKKGF